MHRRTLVIIFCLATTLLFVQRKATTNLVTSGGVDLAPKFPIASYGGVSVDNEYIVFDSVMFDVEGGAHLFLPRVAFESFAAGILNNTQSLSQPTRKGSPVGVDLKLNHIWVRTCIDPVHGQNPGLLSRCFLHIKVHFDLADMKLHQHRYDDSTTYWISYRYNTFSEYFNEACLQAFSFFHFWNTHTQSVHGQTPQLRLIVKWAMQPSANDSMMRHPVNALLNRIYVLVGLESSLRGVHLRQLVFKVDHIMSHYETFKYCGSHHPESHRRAKSVYDLILDVAQAEASGRATQLNSTSTTVHEVVEESNPEDTVVLWMRRSNRRRIMGDGVKDAALLASVDLKPMKMANETFDSIHTLLSKVDIVFGVHGADFSNLVVLPDARQKRMVVIQLCHCGYQNCRPHKPHYFATYAVVKSQLYMQIDLKAITSCSSSGGEPLHHNSDFELSNTTVEVLGAAFGAAKQFVRYGVEPQASQSWVEVLNCTTSACSQIFFFYRPLV